MLPDSLVTEILLIDGISVSMAELLVILDSGGTSLIWNTAGCCKYTLVSRVTTM